MTTKEAWGRLVMLCSVALVGCGKDSSGAPGDDVEGTGGAPIDVVDGGRRNFVVKTVSAESCLPRPLGTYGDGGPVGVYIVEATETPCDCSRPGRAASPSDEIAAVREGLTVDQVCGGNTGLACSGYCGCRILELAGSSSDPTSPRYACQNHTTIDDPSFVGFCYIEPGRVDENGMPAPLGNPELMAGCESTEPARIRFIGADTPLPGANLYVAASGASNPAP